METTTASPDRASASRGRLADLGIAIALVVTAFVIRLGGLPDDGLFHDDALAAAAITLTAPGQFLQATVEHPGFNVLLLPLRPFAVARPTVLVYPVLVAGALAPAFVYWLFRAGGFRRSVGTAIAAIVVAAPVAVAMSAHVKSYVVDLIIVATLAALLPRITEARWTARGALLWVVAALLVGSISVFALVATAVAAIVLLVDARDDRRTRFVAVALQGGIQALYVLAITRTYNEAEPNRFWRARGGYIEVTANPVQLVGDTFDHFDGVVATFPDVDGILRTIVAVAALVGLLVAARRPRAVTARFLLALLVVAAAGAILKVLPFGAEGSTYLGRLSLWLAPSVAYGLAEFLQLGFRAIRSRPALRTVGDTILYVGAIIIVVTAFGKAPAYPVPGSRPATAFVDEHLTDSDVVLLLPRSAYAFGVETDQPVDLDLDPQSGFGTRLRFDEGIVSHEGIEPTPDLGEQVADADRVLVFSNINTPRVLERAEPALEVLREAGFAPGEQRRFRDTVVTTWVRA